jgi:hypothetical protein
VSSAGASARFTFLRAWHVIVIAWLLAFATRPFLLGFYDDDWAVILIPTQHTAAFSWERFTFYMELYANRPLTGALSFILSSLCSSSAVLWHSAAAVMALAAALALRTFFRSLLRLCGRDHDWAADAGAALWLLFPWTLGTISRPTCCPTIGAVAFLALSGTALFEGWRRGRVAWIVPGLCFLASCLMYEALYGQFLTLFAIGWLCGVHRRIGARGFALSALPFVVVQVLAAAWNRLAPLLTSLAPSKSFCPAWWGVASDNLLRLRYFIGHSAHEVSPLVEVTLLGTFALCGGALGWQLLRKDSRSAAWHSFAVLGACGLGVLIGLLVLSVAGYSIRGVGLASRTTMAFSVWLASALAVGLGSLPNRPRLLRIIGTGCVALVGGQLVFATQMRVREWAQAWAIEQEVLADAPLDDLARAHSDAVVLYLGPEMHEGVGVFGYMRNLDLAMEYTYPELKSQHFCCAARDNWVTTWDGRQFEQHLSKYEPWTRWKVWNQRDTPEVWVWVRGSDRARRVAAPFTFHGQTNNENADEPVFQVELPFTFCGVAASKDTEDLPLTDRGSVKGQRSSAARP